MFEKIQNRILKRLDEYVPFSVNQKRSILEVFIKYDESVCALAFGDFGSKLKILSESIDFEHPEVKSGNFLSCLIKDSNTLEKIDQTLQLCQLSIEAKLENIFETISRNIVRTILPDIKSGVDTLKNNNHLIRLIKSKEKRNEFRLRKNICPVSLGTGFYNIWDNISDLESYSRFKNCYQEQIDDINNRANVYEKLGLKSMSAEMRKSVGEFESHKKDQYHSFQRCPLGIATVVLAKMHGFKLTSTQTLDGLIHSITIPYSFYSDLENIAGKKFDYMPRAYPFHLLELPDVVGIIEKLESFPEANGKPIFDHYIVVVPSIMEKGKFIENKEQIDFDNSLIKEKRIAPALMGEKDGKCYFICLCI